MNPIEDIKTLMDNILQICREQKIEVDLEAYFTKGKERQQYLWKLK